MFYELFFSVGPKDVPNGTDEYLGKEKGFGDRLWRIASQTVLRP
jgi:hypothetical protein